MVERVSLREIRKYFELSEYENTMYKNSWDTAKAVLRGKFIALKCFYEKNTCPNIFIYHLFIIIKTLLNFTILWAQKLPLKLAEKK